MSELDLKIIRKLYEKGQIICSVNRPTIIDFKHEEQTAFQSSIFYDYFEPTVGLSEDEYKYNSVIGAIYEILGRLKEWCLLKKNFEGVEPFDVYCLNTESDLPLNEKNKSGLLNWYTNLGNPYTDFLKDVLKQSSLEPILNSIETNSIYIPTLEFEKLNKVLENLSSKPKINLFHKIIGAS